MLAVKGRLLKQSLPGLSDMPTYILSAWPGLMPVSYGAGEKLLMRRSGVVTSNTNN